MFREALNGLRMAFRTEKNIQRHTFIGLGMIFGIFLFNGTTYHLILATTSITLVICLELVNTAIEKLADFIHPGYSVEIKIIKDISAGAVLLAVFFSIVTALVIALTF